jgi:hypothetical protein
MESRGKTLFIDIDGTILKHQKDASGVVLKRAEILKGVRAAFNGWCSKGYRLILTTGRNESMRSVTEQQLCECGLFWDLLIMGIGGGERILINDITDPEKPKAIAINVKRDEGFEDIDELYHEAKVKAGGSNQNKRHEI